MNEEGPVDEPGKVGTGDHNVLLMWMVLKVWLVSQHTGHPQKDPQ